MKHKEEAVRCRYCGAEAGLPCRTKAGGFAKKPHTVRSLDYHMDLYRQRG